MSLTIPEYYIVYDQDADWYPCGIQHNLSDTESVEFPIDPAILDFQIFLIWNEAQATPLDYVSRFSPPGGTFDYTDPAIDPSYTQALGCRVYRKSTQALSANVAAALAWSTEDNDNDACWSAGIPTKLYAKTDGYYTAGGGFRVGTLTGHLECDIARNGTDTLASNKSYFNNVTALISVSTSNFYMNVDDYIEIYALATSNSTISAASATNEYNNFGFLVRIA